MQSTSCEMELTVRGAFDREWIQIGGFALQPSEIMKVCLVFALAKYFNNIDLDRNGFFFYKNRTYIII